MIAHKRKIGRFPWRYKESLVFILSVIIIGIVLQVTIGKVDFNLFRAPVNIITGVCIVLFLAIFSLARKTPFYRWFSGVPFSVTLIGALLAFGLVMGLIPQQPQADSQQHAIITLPGFNQVTSSWYFVLVYFITLLSLGALIARRLIRFNIRDYAFYLNHIGLWTLLFSAGLGAPDMKRYMMYVKEGELEWRAFDGDRRTGYLPVTIQLNDFDMEVYPPKLILLNRLSGKLQPESKPDYFPVGREKTNGVLGDWKIEVNNYIHDAIPDNDGTYRSVAIPAAAPAANVTATHTATGDVRKGWVCYGNTVQPHRVLPLNSDCCIFMTQPQPRRFLSDVDVFFKNEPKIHAVLEVNKPLKAGGWTIYQTGYDRKAGRMSAYSSLELVYDPWLYPAYAGIALLAAGSVCLVCFGNRKKKSYELE
ncbi:MAG: cytochrome c biogenesis protein ResB [Prevotellaceae bacterium]|jgi:hypothetical protein|nr:cytochrome c biogenesis protein ResB [Prevotellaceae bacterium]